MRRPLFVGRATSMALTHSFLFITKEEKHWYLPNNRVVKNLLLKLSQKFIALKCALFFLSIASFISSCSSQKTIGLNCKERYIEIFVDEEYIGRDLVYIPAPKGREFIEVSCRENGVEVLHRRLNVKDYQGKLVDLQIPQNYKYSSKPF